MSMSSGQSPGGSFRIDLDHAPEAIKDLEAARDELRSIRDAAFKLGKIDAGSRDSVSIDAAARLSAVAVSGPGSFVDAMNAGLEQVESLLAAMRADVNAYRRTESDNEAKLRS